MTGDEEHETRPFGGGHVIPRYSRYWTHYSLSLGTGKQRADLIPRWFEARGQLDPHPSSRANKAGIYCECISFTTAPDRQTITIISHGGEVLGTLAPTAANHCSWTKTHLLQRDVWCAFNSEKLLQGY